MAFGACLLASIVGLTLFQESAMASTQAVANQAACAPPLYQPLDRRLAARDLGEAFDVADGDPA